MVGFAVAARSSAAYAATAVPETSTTARTDAAAFEIVDHAPFDLRRPWRAIAGVSSSRRAVLRDS
ncbi:hypothetical protein [Agromyces marinus]|nr:hypothetical protein [Agromyces marinus]